MKFIIMKYQWKNLGSKITILRWILPKISHILGFEIPVFPEFEYRYSVLNSISVFGIWYRYCKPYFGYNQKCLFSKIQPILSVVQMLSTEKLQENDGQECAKHSFQGFFTKKASRSRNTSSLSDVERVKCRKVILRTSFIIKLEVIRQF